MKFFHNLYVRFFSWFTFLLIGWATSAVNKLMILIGKDPNYITPSKPAYKVPLEVRIDESNLDKAWIVDSKVRSPAWLAVMGNDNFYVRNPKSHPIINLRIQWEEKQRLAKETLQKTDNEATVHIEKELDKKSE